MTALALTEKQFQQQVLDAARLFGWAAYHTFDSRRSAPGFPDLVLVRGEHILFVELKKQTGKLTHSQAEWIARLGGVKKASAYVWRPDDWNSIERTLQRGIA